MEVVAQRDNRYFYVSLIYEIIFAIVIGLGIFFIISLENYLDVKAFVFYFMTFFALIGLIYFVVKNVETYKNTSKIILEYDKSKNVFLLHKLNKLYEIKAEDIKTLDSIDFTYPYRLLVLVPFGRTSVYTHEVHKELASQMDSAVLVLNDGKCIELGPIKNPGSLCARIMSIKNEK